MATVSDLLDRFVELFNAERYEEAERDFAPNGYSEEVGTGRRFTPAEGSANARQWRQAFPDARGTITSKVIEGNKGAAEIIWRGTNRGPLMGQPATNKSATVRAVVFIDTDGGRIVRLAHYIDLAGLLAQVGVGTGMAAGQRT